jgi:hypothetical protein
MTDHTSQHHQFQHWPRSEVTPAKGTTPGTSAARHIAVPTSQQHSKLTIYNTLSTFHSITWHTTLKTPTYFTSHWSQHHTLSIETLIDSVGHHRNASGQSSVIILLKRRSTSKSLEVWTNHTDSSNSSHERVVAVPGTPADLPQPRRPPPTTRGTHTWPFGVKKVSKITLPRAWGHHTYSSHVPVGTMQWVSGYY